MNKQVIKAISSRIGLGRLHYRRDKYSTFKTKYSRSEVY